MSKADEERDRAGLEADLESDLQELEREFEAAASEDAGGDKGGDGAAIGRGAPPAGPGAPGSSEALFEPDELEDECALAWGGLMRLYATQALDLEDDEIPDGVIDAEETGRRLSPKAAAVANKWLPLVSSRFSEEIRLALAVASTSALTMYELAAVKRELDRERGDHDEAEEAEAPETSDGGTPAA